MNHARAAACVAAAGSVLVSLLLVPASAPVQAAPGDGPQRIAFTDDRDAIWSREVEYVQPDDASSTPPFDRPIGSAIRRTGDEQEHAGELSASSYLQGDSTFVSTKDDANGEIYFSNDGELNDAVRVTCNGDVETHPVLSQYGEAIAYATNAGGGDWNIRLAEPDASITDARAGMCAGWTSRPLTTSKGDDLWPTFAPVSEGELLVFSSTRLTNTGPDGLPGDPLGDLYVLDPFGDHPETDLQRITVGRGADTQPTVGDLEVGGSDASGWIALTTTRFRPDGSIGLVSLDARESAEGKGDGLVEPAFAGGFQPQGSEPSLPTWSGGAPTHLAYTSVAGSSDGDVYVAAQRDDGGSATTPRFENPVAVADEAGVRESHPSWEHAFQYDSGSLVATATLTFTRADQLADVSDAVAADGSARRRVVHRTIDGGRVPFEFDETQPSFSPDGSRIVFSTDIRPGEEDFGRELWVADSDGQNAEPLRYERDTGDVDLDPVWSPRGDLIAFTRYEYFGEGGYATPVIATIPIRTGTEPQASVDVRSVEPAGAATASDRQASWAPDGTRLVIAREVTRPPGLTRDPNGDDDGRQTLYVIPATGPSSPGSQLQYLSPSRVCVCRVSVSGRSPSWSGDGTTIAYVAGQSIRTVRIGATSGSPPVTDVTPPLAVTGFEGPNQQGPPTPSRSTVSAADDPAWSPDGTEIAFSGQPAGQPDQRGIYAIHPDGTGLRTVTDDRGPETDPVWSPRSEADMSVTVAITGSPAAPGDPITATFTVRNNSSQGTAHDVVLTTGFTPGGTVSAASPPAECNPDGSGCSFDHLDPGESRQYAVTLTYPAPVNGTAQGTVTSTTLDPDLTNNTAQAPYTVVALPVTTVDVGVRVTLDGPTGWVGGHRTATVVVRNHGPAAANAVKLAMTYPTGTPPFAPESTTPICLDGSSTCSLGTMAPGAKKTFTVPLTMLREGTGKVTGTVSTTSPDADAGNDADAATLKVLQPTIRLLPAVARPGAVVMAFGEKMPPGSKVTLRWVPGITVSGPVKFKVDPDGTMRAPMVLVRHDLLGNRVIRAKSVGGLFTPVEGPMLVAERLSTAPDFLARG